MDLTNIIAIKDAQPDALLLISLNGRLVPILKRQAILNGRFTIQVRAFGGHIITITVDESAWVAVVSQEAYAFFSQ